MGSGCDGYCPGNLSDMTPDTTVTIDRSQILRLGQIPMGSMIIIFNSLIRTAMVSMIWERFMPYPAKMVNGTEAM